MAGMFPPFCVNLTLILLLFYSPSYGHQNAVPASWDLIIKKEESDLDTLHKIWMKGKIDLLRDLN